MSTYYTEKGYTYTDPAAYDDRVRQPIERYVFSLWNPILLRYLRTEITAGMTVADLGCGTFIHVQHMGKAGHIYAVDVSQEMLDYGKPKIEAMKDKVTVLCEDCSNTSIPSESCDVVWSDGLSELMDADALFAEISRIDKPGTRCFILFHNRLHPVNFMVRTYYRLLGKKKMMCSLSEMKDLARRHGFELEHFESTGVFFYAPSWLQKHLIPMWKMLNKVYQPYQKNFPLGSNILCTFKKSQTNLASPLPIYADDIR